MCLFVCLFICLVLFWVLENEYLSRLTMIFLYDWLDEAEVCVSKINCFHSFGLTCIRTLKFENWVSKCKLGLILHRLQKL